MSSLFGGYFIVMSRRLKERAVEAAVTVAKWSIGLFRIWCDRQGQAISGPTADEAGASCSRGQATSLTSTTLRSAQA